MEVMRLSDTNQGVLVARAVAVLRAGGVVLYPTDTLYGLGGDALSDAAVAKIYAIKGREEKKPIHAIASDMEMVSRYAELNDAGKALAEKFWPGALTLIFEKSAQGRSASGGKRHTVDTGIARDINTIGFRIPDNEFCIALTREFGAPITATSANISDMVPQQSVEKILAQLGLPAQAGDAASYIDLIIDAGELPERAPSTVVDVSGRVPVILREGAIPAISIL